MIRIVLAGLMLGLMASCAPPPTAAPIQLAGTTMGTTYSVLFGAPADAFPNAQQAVDSLLVAINQSLSTYIPTSLISRLNASADAGTPIQVDDHFLRVFVRSKEIYRDTEGAFNPAVGPLVEAWGFGATERSDMPPARVDSLLALVDFDAFQLTDDALGVTKTIAGARLDFSAIAKGYGVDAVAELLADRGIDHYFVEIGGEVAVRGTHPAGRPWRVGVDRPVENATQRELQAVVNLPDGGMATSGNYRNFYEEDGRKVAHTIDPETGYSALSPLLSVTIVAHDCMTADAYATAAMVLGPERALEMIARRDFLEGYLVIGGEDGAYDVRTTPAFETWIVPDAP